MTDNLSALAQIAVTDLQTLCVTIDSRRVGSPGNRAATDLFAHRMAAAGFAVETPEFDCIDWSDGGAQLTLDGDKWEVLASPYSLGCEVSAPLSVVTTIEDLAAADLTGRIVLLHGDIAAEPLMPKNFPFYNPDAHRRIYQLLEAGRPHAIIAATSRNPAMMGGVYPFPMFEDGDFDIPSVYMTDEAGRRLAAFAGHEVTLVSHAKRIPARGCNVIACKGDPAEQRVVLCAHIDARIGTPGAGDNASGVCVLLLLAELLADYSDALGIELVVMNGEDYYANPGEQQYLALNAGRFDEILLAVNLDDVGYDRGRSAYSLYGCPPEIDAVVRRTFDAYPELVAGDPWYQGDHGIFLMNERPALAITSELLADLMAELTHTPHDTPDRVDTRRLARLALALRDLLGRLSRRLPG
jgi:aminopeptidase YwaD